MKELLQEILGHRDRKEVREKIGKSSSYVSQILNGREVPTIEVAAVIASHFAPERMKELMVASVIARFDRGGLGQEDEALKDRALEELQSCLPERPRDQQIAGRSFLDFPELFQPLVAITGDKREERNQHVMAADFGVVTATPADTRWLCNLQLSKDTTQQVDKNFVTLCSVSKKPSSQPDEKPPHEIREAQEAQTEYLIENYAEKNLLIIGSPAANHVARMVNETAIFRFNYGRRWRDSIDDLIRSALIEDHPIPERASYHDKYRTAEPKLLRNLFSGGIFDPTYPPDFIAAHYWQSATETSADWAVLSFAANPFYAMKCRREGRRNDHQFVSILAAGIHHPGTAHAVRMLGVDHRKKAFEKHPYGGVLRVSLNLNKPRYRRVEDSKCMWEDDIVEDRRAHEDQLRILLENLELFSSRRSELDEPLMEVQVDKQHAEDCLHLLKSLAAYQPR